MFKSAFVYCLEYSFATNQGTTFIFSDYMDGVDCGKTLDLGGAVVFSHHFYMTQPYNHSITCTLRFKAQNAGWKLMLRILELDVPDRQFNGLCNDALWVYNADSIYNMDMVMVSASLNLGPYMLAES